MVVIWSAIQQDTVKSTNVIISDSAGIKSDSITAPVNSSSTGLLPDSIKLSPEVSVDTVSETLLVSRRAYTNDYSLCKKNKFPATIEPGAEDMFPYNFVEQTGRHTEERSYLIRHRMRGEDIPVQPLHEDWIIFIILISVFLFAFVRAVSEKILPGLTRFLMFRRINDPSARDTGVLFQWQSTIQNLISFFLISLFGYSAASYYNLIPDQTDGIVFWLILLAVIIAAVTLRHIVCEITGYFSGERELFREYLLSIYHSYRISSLLLFVILILLLYTSLFPFKVYFIFGIIVLGLMYLIRIFRLMIIFITYNISIFYLILYLCALEILPVVISVKYFTGLV